MTRKKRPKVVWVGSTRVIPWTAEEHRRIDRRIRKRDEKLRRRYREIHGKKVDWVSRSIEDGRLYFTVRFTDKTALHLQVKPELVVEGRELSDWSTGDDKVLRTYYRRRDRS